MDPARRASLVWMFGAMAALGCGGGGDDDGLPGGDAGDGDNQLAITIPVELELPMMLFADTPVSLAIPVSLPADFDLGEFEGATIDGVGTLEHMSITRLDVGDDAPTIALELKIASGDVSEEACAGVPAAAAATITGDATFSTSTVAPVSIAVSPAALATLSDREFTVCATTTSSANVMITLDAIIGVLAIDAACDEPAEDLAGVWTGTYACQDECGGVPAGEGGDIVITVHQAGDTAVYTDDGNATYLGSVCGTEFRHLGGKAGYWEYGRFTRTGPTTATKSSTWISTMTPDCGGTCEDAVELTGG